MTAIEPFDLVPLTDEQQHGIPGTIVHAFVDWLDQSGVLPRTEIPEWADDIRALGLEIASEIESDLGM
ncbi:hypothetical protein [Kitasatospora griseola]|uniref:hypothetical protein n=1 Tax=Kitasatospora griseola TaxID=2064 RepID=UPI003666DDC7